MANRYTPRQPLVSRTSTPLKKGISPTLQIRLQREYAEESAEEDYQQRRKDLVRRMRERRKRLEEYFDQFENTGSRDKKQKQGRNETKRNMKRNQGAATLSYIDSAGKKVKVTRKMEQAKLTAQKWTPPTEPYKGSVGVGQWVEVKVNGVPGDGFKGWKKAEIGDFMVELGKRGEATTPSPSNLSETGTNADTTYHYIGREFWDTIETIYDYKSKKLWARIPIDEGKSIELKDENLSKEMGFSADSDENDSANLFGGL
tara:strand:- start:881 stop:1654 length:774 start_codon:yes stop_codon:yes gene_type:complete